MVLPVNDAFVAAGRSPHLFGVFYRGGGLVCRFVIEKGDESRVVVDSKQRPFFATAVANICIAFLGARAKLNSSAFVNHSKLLLP